MTSDKNTAKSEYLMSIFWCCCSIYIKYSIMLILVDRGFLGGFCATETGEIYAVDSITRRGSKALFAEHLRPAIKFYPVAFSSVQISPENMSYLLFIFHFCFTFIFYPKMPRKKCDAKTFFLVFIFYPMV